MSGDLGDLLPLFLDEAGGRLDRLAGLLDQAESDAGAAVQVRRELHALKGAARMLGLSEIAELCHRCEDCLVGDEATDLEGVRELTDRLAEALDDLREDGAGPGGGEPGGARARGRRRRSEIRGGSGELRVATRIVDGLAERSARLRVSAASSASIAEQLFEIAHAAERALGEGERERTLGELATSVRRIAMELERTSRVVHKLSDQQLEALLRLQIQPLSPFLSTLARHTRELARSLDKEVSITTSGGDVQLDRRILEAIREASLHLVRNAVDHGIESAAERSDAGKEPVGRIRIEAMTEGDRVRLEVADDGRGIEAARVVEVAVERGLINPAAAARLTPAEAYQLLELPGFTTRDRATDLSGRGVGMDAVAAAIRSVGGDIWIRSTPGQGTTVTVELPVARRGERVLVVRVGELELAIPSALVGSFRRLSPEMVVREEGRLLLRRGDEAVAAVFVSTLFGQPRPPRPVAIESTVGGGLNAIVVDAVVGEEEVFVRPLPAVAGAPPAVEGVAVLASGRPVAVLSPQRLGPLDLDVSEVDDRERAVAVLLVEDTRASREMLRRLLEDGGFVVTAASSAAEALDRLDAASFDCMVTDVEMPDEDGLELIRRLRSSERWGELPVVVVSTRTGSADRLAGLSAGADAWIAKGTLDADQLIQTIRKVATPP